MDDVKNYAILSITSPCTSNEVGGIDCVSGTLSKHVMHKMTRNYKEGDRMSQDGTIR